jgi:hypothetical protein
MGFAPGVVGVGVLPVLAIRIIEIVVLAAAVDAESEFTSIWLGLFPVLQLIWKVFRHRAPSVAERPSSAAAGHR